MFEPKDFCDDTIDAGWKTDTMTLFIGQIHERVLQMIWDPGFVFCLPKAQMCLQLPRHQFLTNTQ